MPNVWAKANTSWQAMLAARREYGTRKPSYCVVYSFPERNNDTVYINGMGTLYGRGLVKIMDTREPFKA